MIDTKQTGLVAELTIQLALLKQGYTVLMPLGDKNRYDLVVEVGGTFLKVQVKSARLIEGAIEANLYRVLKIHGEKDRFHHVAYSENEVDIFALYCAEIDKICLVPYQEVKDQKNIRLRVDKPVSGQQLKIRYASDYDITRKLG